MIVEFYQKNTDSFYRLDNIEEFSLDAESGKWKLAVNDDGERGTMRLSCDNYSFIKCEMNDLHIDLDIFKEEVRNILNQSISSDYVGKLLDHDEFILTIRSDVEESSGWMDEGTYNEDDIRLAIGRILCWKFEIEY